MLVLVERIIGGKTQPELEPQPGAANGDTWGGGREGEGERLDRGQVGRQREGWREREEERERKGGRVGGREKTNLGKRCGGLAG